MINFWSFIPKILLLQVKWKDFFTKLKEYYDNYIYYINDLLSMVDIDSKYFLYLGNQFGCYYDSNMTESEMKISIYESIKINRQPLSFEYWKEVIDRITLGDSRIYKGAVLQEPVFYGTAVYGLDDYADSIVINEEDFINASRYANAIIGTALYGVANIDKGYGDSTILYGNAIMGGESFLYINEVLGNSKLPNIYIDLRIEKSLLTNNLLDKVIKRLSVLKGSFFAINIGIVEEYYFKTYIRIR
jgi:hypothetical protein